MKVDPSKSIQISKSNLLLLSFLLLAALQPLVHASAPGGWRGRGVGGGGFPGVSGRDRSRLGEGPLKGERRRRGLLWVLLVQLPSTARGCRRMEGLEVLSSWRQVSQGLWITWGNIDYLFSYVRQCFHYSVFVR